MSRRKRRIVIRNRPQGDPTVPFDFGTDTKKPPEIGGLSGTYYSCYYVPTDRFNPVNNLGPLFPKRARNP